LAPTKSHFFGKRRKGSLFPQKRGLKIEGIGIQKKTPHHPPSNRLAESMAPTWHQPKPKLDILNTLNIDFMFWHQ
jgi:hypothetical protein